MRTRNEWWKLDNDDSNDDSNDDVNGDEIYAYNVDGNDFSS